MRFWDKFEDDSIKLFESLGLIGEREVTLKLNEDELRYLYQNLVIYSDKGIRELRAEMKKDGCDSMHHSIMARKVYDLLNYELLCNRSLYQKCGELMVKHKIDVWRGTSNV